MLMYLSEGRQPERQEQDEREDEAGRRRRCKRNKHGFLQQCEEDPGTCDPELGLLLADRKRSQGERGRWYKVVGMNVISHPAARLIFFHGWMLSRLIYYIFIECFGTSTCMHIQIQL